MPIEDFYYGGGPATIDEEDGVLAKLAKSVVLPPLAWLGQTLDKPGRAIRGLLAGQPGELLNLIPLSDTLNITDPNNSVSGRDLLRQYGLADKEDNWGNFLGGLGAEILLDPINALTLGAGSSLTAAGRTAKLAGTIEKTWAGRIGAEQAGVRVPQAGLLGVRTPWWAEAMGAPAASKQFLTGPTGQYLAGQVFNDARSLVDKIPYVGKSVGQFGDKIQAMMQSSFVPGAGITMDPRITNTLANTVEDATAAARAATLDTRMAAFDPRVQASELLTQYGVHGPAAEDTIGRYFNSAIEKTDGLYKPQQVHLYPPGDAEAARYAQRMETFAQPYGKVGMEDKLQELVQAIADPTRQSIDKARDLAIQGGFKVGENPNPWGLDYNPRQAQESGVSKGSAAKSRKIPQAPLWGGTNQLDDLINTSASAGIANQPIPAGLNQRQWERRIDKMLEPEIKAHLEQAKAIRDAKYGKAPEPSVADMATESANTSVKAGRVGAGIEAVEARPSGITLESFINNIDEAGKSVATPEFVKALHDLAPHLDEAAFTKAVTSLDESLGSLGKKELRSVAKSIGAAGADPTLGVTAKDNILMKIMEAKNATPTQAAKGTPTSIPAQVKEVTQAAEPAKLRYPIELSDANLEKETRKLFKVIAKASPEIVEAKRGFYRNDVLGATEHYTRNMAEQAGKGQGLLTAIADQSVPFEAIKANPDNFVSVNDLLKKMKLTGADVEQASDLGSRVYTQGAKPTLLDIMAKKGKTTVAPNGGVIGTSLANNELKEHFIPKDLAENLVREAEGPGFNRPHGILEKISDVTNATRTWLTQPWIPFHTRNTWEGAIQSKLAGGLDSAVVRDVAAYKAGALTDPAKIAEMHKYANEAFNTGAAFRHQVAENMGESVVGKASKVTTPFVEQAGSTALQTTKGFLEGYTPSVAASRGEKYATLNPKESVFVQQGLRASEAADDVQRMSMYVSLRKQGYAPQAAADAVTAAHLDYSKLTPFEKQLRSLIPFYCVPTTHEILTKEGWKTQDKLVVGEEVMSYEQESGDMTWVPLEAINVYDFDGMLLSITRRGGLEFQFTEDHNWPVIIKGGTVKHSYGTYTYPDRKAMVKGRDLTANHNLIRTGHYIYPEDSLLSPRLASILGWVVTDGYHRWKKGYCEMMVYQSPGKHLEIIKSLLGTKPRKPHPDTGVVCVPVALPDVKEITRVFKSKSDLSKIVTLLSDESADAMWQAMMLAEGCMSGTNLTIETFCQSTEVNKEVADAFQILTLMRGRNMAVLDTGTSHYITTSQYLNATNSTTSEHKGIKRVRYIGKVWCPTTKYGTWLMRNNGHVIVTGNSFSKGNIIRTAQQFGDPGAISSLLRAGTAAGSEGYVPGYVSQGAAIPVPGAEEGKQRYMSGLSTPFDDELLGSLVALAQGSPIEAARRAMSSVNPLVKLGITAGTGRQLYSGRKLDEFAPTGITSFLPNYPANVLAEAIGATPLGRVATTANSMVGGRDQNLLLKLLTGIRTTDIDPALATQMAAKDAVSTQLKRTGMTNTYENISPKAEFRDPETQPEELQRLLGLLKAIQAAGKDMREQRQTP